MAKTSAPTEHDAAEAKRLALTGLARGDHVTELAKRLAPLHPKNDTFPGEVLLGLGADALELARASRQSPLAYEGISDQHLPECEFHGAENRKLRYALLAVGAIHGGIELDVLEEVTWSQTDDFWYYALCAFVAWTRAAAEHAGLSIKETCQRLANKHNVDLAS